METENSDQPVDVKSTLAIEARNFSIIDRMIGEVNERLANGGKRTMRKPETIGMFLNELESKGYQPSPLNTSSDPTISMFAHPDKPNAGIRIYWALEAKGIVDVSLIALTAESGSGKPHMDIPTMRAKLTKAAAKAEALANAFA